MLRQIEWEVQNDPTNITTKNGVLIVATLFLQNFVSV